MCPLAAVLVCTGMGVNTASARTPAPLRSAPTSSTAPKPATATVHIDKPILALGEALTLTLTLTRALTAPGPALTSLDLAPLAPDFEVLGQTSGSDGLREDLTLTLYPRRLGRVELPRFGQPGPPLVVTVIAGSAQVPQVHFKFGTDATALVMRHGTQLTLEACDDGDLQWQRPALPAGDGYALRELGETEIITTRDGQRCTAHRWHWAVLPTAPGVLRIALPTLKAAKFGTPLRYPAPLPPFEAEVAALPSWLPAEVAVGPVSIDPAADALPASAGSGVVGQPLPWRFTVRGDFSAPVLRELVHAQLAAHPQWTAYPASVQPVPGADVTPRFDVTLFGLPAVRGTIVQPELRLPWFDTATRTLQQTRLPARWLPVADPARDRTVRGLWLAGAAVATGVMALWLSRVLAWRVRRWRFARAARQSVTPNDLHHAVLAFSLTQAPPAPTLGVWWTRMVSQCHSQGLPPLVDTLARLRYGRPGGIDAVALSHAKSEVLNWLRTVKKERRPGASPSRTPSATGKRTTA